MIDSFIQYLKHEKRSSDHTILAYQTDLSQFETYLSTTYAIDNAAEVSDKMIRSWLVYLADKPLSAKSINRKLSAVKALYRFLQKTGQVGLNPAVNLNGPKVKKRLPVVISENDMQLLFTEIPFENTYKGKRDLLILQLFYQTGMRLSELRNLKQSDIDYSNRIIKVTGKRNKQRLLPLHPSLITQIAEYIDLCMVEFSRKEAYLILNNKGVQASEKFVYRCVNDYLSKVTKSSKKSPHIIRHTFATHMLNKGADLNTIKELLGHANLAATQIYTHNSISKLKEVYKQAHPKGQ